jgi:hypothetical protein
MSLSFEPLRIDPCEPHIMIPIGQGIIQLLSVLVARFGTAGV